MDRRFRFTIPIVWQYVREVRQRLRDSLADQSPELREGSIMVASELVENAIKYGDVVPGAPEATIELYVDKQRIEIVVTNGLACADRAQEIDALLRRIADAPNRTELYVDRLKRLMDDPNSKGKLGLHRIGLEAGFDLKSTYNDGILTITATRGIS